MARELVVSRTITSTLATVLAVNTETKTVDSIVVEVTGVYEDDNKLLAKINTSSMIKANLKPVSIEKKELQTFNYSQPQDEFMLNATKKAVAITESK